MCTEGKFGIIAEGLVMVKSLKPIFRWGVEHISGSGMEAVGVSGYCLGEEKTDLKQIYYRNVFAGMT